MVSFVGLLLLVLYEKNNARVCQSGASSPMLPFSWNDAEGRKLPPSYFLLHFIHISNMSAIADAYEFATINTYRIRTDTVRIT